MEQKVIAKLPPAEFTEEFIDRVGSFGVLCLGMLRGMPNLPRRDIAKPEVGRQFRGVGLRGNVTPTTVILDMVLQKACKSLMSARLSRAPQVIPSECPVGCSGRQAPVIEFFRCHRFFQRS